MTSNPDAAEFAARFGEWIQCAHAIPLVDLRTALEVAFAAAGVERGTRVILSPFVGRWVQEVLQKIGAVPEFAPVRSRDLTLDPDELEPFLVGDRPIVLLSHFFGLPAAVDEIHDLVDSRGGCVIQEGAYALGARSGSGPIGARGICVFAAHAADFRVDRRAGILACEDWWIAERVLKLASARRIYVGPELAEIALDVQEKEARLWLLRQEIGRVYDREFAARPLDSLTPLVARPPHAASRLYYPVLIDNLVEIARIARRTRQVELDLPELLIDREQVPDWKPRKRGVAGLPIHLEMTPKHAERVVDVLLSLLE